MNGLLITLEGIEGSGKSTQIELLKARLEALELPVTITRQPGGTRIGESIRKILLDPKHVGMDSRAELLLYAADRAQHVAEVVQPKLEADHICLCDRFADSTTAYQGAGRAIGGEDIDWLQRFALQGCMPDLTLLIDLPVKEGLARAAKASNPDRIEREALDFHERVREGFLAIAKKDPDRVKVIDGSESVEAVAEAIWAHAAPVVERVR
jgi:dTMP kinase